jgi:hypothetical protein
MVVREEELVRGGGFGLLWWWNGWLEDEKVG